MPEYYVTSADGTAIAYDRFGDGPPVVLVGGGLDDGSENEPLAEALSPSFTVINYTRRGRGRSGDTAPYSTERELEDLRALIDSVDAPAHLFGASSGGAVALEAAAARLPVDRIAVYDVPYNVGDAASAWQAYVRDLGDALAAGDIDLALVLFMRLAGSSEDDIAEARRSPLWTGLRDLAPTLAYDAAFLGDGPPPTGRLKTIDRPTLVMTGAHVDARMAGLPTGFFGAAADAIAATIPTAERRTIEVASHIPDPDVIAPVLITFYEG
jgi:pimeloyl-ACP methyl ester carboxylesterase